MFNNKNIFVALTYKCNAYCTKCMTRHHINKGIEMDDEMLKRLYYLLKVNNYSGLVSVGTGEALLYPEINSFISNILDVNSKIRLRILTNGMLLNADDSTLFDPRCIWGVTMDAFNQESLSMLQKGVDIEKVKHNIASVAKRYGGSSMYLNFTVYRTNVDEILPFVIFAVENGIKEIYLTELKVYTGFEKNLEGYAVIHDDHLNKVLKEVKKYLEVKGISTRGITVEKPFPRTDCYMKNIASPVIDVDGKVSFCSGREDVYVGNLFDHDIAIKWQSFAEKIRKTNVKWCEKCHDRICADGTYSLPRTIRKEESL